MKYEGYLIDLDGTMYRGEEAIHGARTFISYLNKENIPYLFLTNNSTYTNTMLLEKLNRLGITASEENILTSATAAAKYIKRLDPQARCYLIGETGLIHAFEEKNLVITEIDCNYVIVGLDRQISYEKLATASLLIRKGATYMITNSDVAIPTEAGLLPGNGAIASAITVSTGVKPLCVGKPETIIMDEAVKQIGIDRKNILMIGDNYDTDIKAGINANIDTMMVLTGFSTKEDLTYMEEQPTYVMENLHHYLHHKELKR